MKRLIKKNEIRPVMPVQPVYNNTTYYKQDNQQGGNQKNPQQQQQQYPSFDDSFEKSPDQQCFLYNSKGLDAEKQKRLVRNSTVSEHIWANHPGYQNTYFQNGEEENQDPTPTTKVNPNKETFKQMLNIEMDKFQ